jgi:hypothetical protein
LLPGVGRCRVILDLAAQQRLRSYLRALDPGFGRIRPENQVTVVSPVVTLPIPGLPSLLRRAPIAGGAAET